MNLDEWKRTLEQVARERQALNETYEGLQRKAAAEAEEAERTSVRAPEEDLVPALLQLVMQFGNFVNIEREHADKLWALLVDALTRLFECYEMELPPGWPPPTSPRSGE